MKLRDYELFIFDFDGTLNMPSILVKLNGFFKKRYKIEYILSHKELFQKKKIEYSNEKHLEKEEAIYNAFYEIYSIIFKPQIKPGAQELLKELKHMKKKIALFSDGKEYRVRRELAMMGLEEYFDLILAADSIKIFKPNPAPLELIVSSFKIPKSKSIYIGDMAVDVMAAKFAGISSCSVMDGMGREKDIIKAGPDFIKKNLYDILEEFKK
jgi:HAD superfamily hydrolase (TIGR01509 family)